MDKQDSVSVDFTLSGMFLLVTIVVAKETDEIISLSFTVQASCRWTQIILPILCSFFEKESIYCWFKKQVALGDKRLRGDDVLLGLSESLGSVYTMRQSQCCDN